MKRITIVTWAGIKNYGTSLQSFALQYALEKKGYTVCLLDRFSITNIFTYCINRVREFVCHMRHIVFFPKNDNRTIFHKTFQNIVRPRTKYQLRRLISHTDVFISGSDQIWNTRHRYDPHMFLDFANEQKRISYATSIGTVDIPAEHMENVKKHLNLYSHIGVRENSAVDAISKLTGRTDIVQVIDPTFLLECSDWLWFASCARLEVNLPNQYILCYFIADNIDYESKVKDIKERSGIGNVVLLSIAKNKINIPDSINIDNVGPNEFVFLINNAQLICTDSFHATAISINLRKNFVDFLRFSSDDRSSQNSRIFDLLTHYKLSHKLYNENPRECLIMQDHNAVDAILAEDRKKSWDYLINAIEK